MRQLALHDSRSGALFSEDEQYRYRLWRRWSNGPILNLLALNPSTADASVNDPTCERSQRRARAWGYGSLIVTKIFALRSTDPRALRQHHAPIGPENNRHIVEVASDTVADGGLVLCGWGEHGHLESRGAAVLRMLADLPLYCLGTNKSGSPVHPLYTPYRLDPIPYRNAQPWSPPSSVYSREVL